MRHEKPGIANPNPSIEGVMNQDACDDDRLHAMHQSPKEWTFHRSERRIPPGCNSRLSEKPLAESSITVSKA